MLETNFHSMLQDETALRWGFLEDEVETVAVVSPRMELVYVNSSGRRLLPENWFGKRCFETLAVGTGECAWTCPTIQAVDASEGLVYCEEHVNLEDGLTLDLGVVVIPMPQDKVRSAKALLFMRKKPQLGVEPGYQETLLKDAASLQGRVIAQLG